MIAMTSFLVKNIVWLLPVPVILAVAFIPGAGAAILAFLRTTIGKVILACVVSGVIGWEGAAHVYSASLTRVEAAHAEALLEQAKMDAEATADIEDAASAREQANDRANKTLRNKVDDYEKKLAARKAPHCALGDDDVRSLRGIAGLAAGSSKRAR